MHILWNMYVRVTKEPSAIWANQTNSTRSLQEHEIKEKKGTVGKAHTKALFRYITSMKLFVICLSGLYAYTPLLSEKRRDGGSLVVSKQKLACYSLWTFYNGARDWMRRLLCCAANCVLFVLALSFLLLVLLYAYSIGQGGIREYSFLGIYRVECNR